MTIRLREMTDEEAETIQRWANSRTAEARLVERAKVIRVAREGKRGKAVAEEVGLNPATVQKWLKRFNETGFAGLQDAERPGKPPRYTPEQVGISGGRRSDESIHIRVAGCQLDAGSSGSVLIDSWEEICQAVREATKYWNQHRHPFF
jgi:hypothetical protein